MLDAEESHAVGTRRGRPLCGFGDGDVDFDLGGGHRLDRRLRAYLLDRFALLDVCRLLPRADRPLVAVDGDDLAVAQFPRRAPTADDGGDT